MSPVSCITLNAPEYTRARFSYEDCKGFVLVGARLFLKRLVICGKFAEKTKELTFHLKINI